MGEDMVTYQRERERMKWNETVDGFLVEPQWGAVMEGRAKSDCLQVRSVEGCQHSSVCVCVCPSQETVRQHTQTVVISTS